MILLIFLPRSLAANLKIYVPFILVEYTEIILEYILSLAVISPCSLFPSSNKSVTALEVVPSGFVTVK